MKTSRLIKRDSICAIKGESMRIIETKAYKFSELSEAAQRKALDSFSTDEYNWSGEWRDTLKTFSDTFHIVVKDWEVSPYRHSYIDFRMREGVYYRGKYLEELEGIDLYKFIQLNFMDTLYPRKYRGSITREAYEKYDLSFPGPRPFYQVKKDKYVSLYSKYLRHTGAECSLTGYCADNDILDPIYNYLKNFNKATTYEELIQECLDSFISAWERDMEWQDSDEYKRETIEANEYEFTEEGRMI